MDFDKDTHALNLDKEPDALKANREELALYRLQRRVLCSFCVAFALGPVAILSFIPGAMYSPPNMQDFCMTMVDGGTLDDGRFLYKADLMSQLGMIYPTHVEYICDPKRENCAELNLVYEKNICAMINVTWFTLANGANYSCQVLASLVAPIVVNHKYDVPLSMAVGVPQMMICAGILLLPRYINKPPTRRAIIFSNMFFSGFVIVYLAVKGFALYILYNPPQLDSFVVPAI